METDPGPGGGAGDAGGGGPGESLAGRTLGNFKVERVLAEGGMGTVYLARHVTLGTPAVVKALTAETARDPEAKARFFLEARLASGIRHPNVVRIFDFGETGDGLLYAVMELVEGEELGKVLAREGRLDPRRVARLLRQVASALEAAHGSPAGPVIHRDLKPSNVIVTRRGTEEQASVLDFGLAKATAGGEERGARGEEQGEGLGKGKGLGEGEGRGERDEGHDADAGGRHEAQGTDTGGGGATGTGTGTGRGTGSGVPRLPDRKALEALGLLPGKSTDPTTVVGTPEYMAPEQVLRGRVDARTDVYALGVLAYECLAGRLPFRADTLVDLLVKQAKEPPPPFAVELGVPAALETIVRRCLEKKPEARYESAAALVAALDRFGHEADRAASGRLARPARGLRTPFAAAVALFVVASLAGVVALVRGGGAAPPSPLVIDLLALKVDGRDALLADPIYVRDEQVRLEGEVPGLLALRGLAPRLSMRLGGRPVEVRTEGTHFVATLRGLPDEAAAGASGVALEATVAWRDDRGEVRETRLLARRLVPDRTPPGLDVAVAVGAPGGLEGRRLAAREARLALVARASDAGSGARAIAAEAEPPLAASVEGDIVTVDLERLEPGKIGHLVIRSADEAGNLGTRVFEVTLDREPPPLEIASGPAASVLGMREGEPHLAVVSVATLATGPLPEVTLEAPDGVRKAEYWAGAEGVSAYRIALLVEGEHTIVARVRDLAGNVAERRRSFAYAVPLRIESARVLGATLAAGAYHARGESAEIEVRANRRLVGGADDDPFVLRAKVPLPSEGRRELSLVVKPLRGDPVTVLLPIVVDRTPPRIALLAPRPFADPLGPAALGDGRSLAVVALVRDRSPVEVAVAGARAVRRAGPLVFARVPCPPDAAALALSIVARDAAGNETPLARRARIDLDPPAVLAVPKLPQHRVHDAISVRVTASEPAVRFLVDGDTRGVKALGPTEAVFDAVMYLDTPLEVLVTVVDAAGNETTVAVPLGREDACAASSPPGAPYTQPQKLLLLGGRGRHCPYCGKRAIGGTAGASPR